MAYSHYEVDFNKKPGRQLVETLTALRNAWNQLRALRGSMIQQKDSDTDFTSIAANFGYAGTDSAAKETNAQASFGEIDSAFGSGDSAITQLLDRHL
jgi:hypothetical protein